MSFSFSSSSWNGIQGQSLEVTVVGCSKLKDTEWISRQDPYVCLEYASTKFRTRTCTDGGKNPVFQEKFVFPLIEGLREFIVLVWNSNTLSFDDFIGTGKIQLNKVLSQGFDDSSWPLQTKTGRYAGEVKLILHYANANHMKSELNHAPSAPPYVPPTTPPPPLYSMPPPPPHSTSYPPSPYPTPHSSPYPTPHSSPYPTPQLHLHSHPSPYPTPQSQPSPYPPSYPAASSPHSSAYPPSPYPPNSAYPPPPYPPPSAYPPPPGTYPPPPY
ncbi:PREDICTED: leucine-rich repeat extensin-like protein 3 isoform X2 [Lupinus angustifolius]|uniref:leucine-rich repeat extensin-like protein 3 isoform X2 n=1 Tax=Lupinus angustifolius TaxID=3871 RepID=UPI00092F1642|nr:PREDICTED: leucine-rich repeat extensin-like protein 3 isoform X2 [Lupinus angustifolius]